MNQTLRALAHRILLAAAITATAVLGACVKQDIQSSGAGGTSGADSDTSLPVFNILAGSELKDVADKVIAFGASIGVTVKFDYTGSIDAVDKLSEKHSYDAAWLSHGKYMQLVPGVKEQIMATEKTMYSRVVLGVKPEKAAELGWESGKVTWKEVAAATKAGKFHFAMTNPSGSNSGFVTLVGVAAELSGKGDALQEADIPEEGLMQFFKGLSLTSGSSGDLAVKFKADPSKADGIINYESVIVGLKNGGLPLDVIVPKEGVITADYPLMLMKTSKQADFYSKLVTYLRDDATQAWIASNTFRTPLKGTGSDEVTNELPFPGNLKVVDAILRSFLDTYSKPASSYFVLDVSGSMDGPRMNDMKASIGALAQGDGSVSGRFSTFRDREFVGLTAFSSTVHPIESFQLTKVAADNARSLTAAAGYVASLHAEDGTAIYSALMDTYPAAQAALKAGDRTVSIVLLTDGENNDGASLKSFLRTVVAAGEPRVPVYGILYGEANSNDMTTMVNATGGRVFDARKQSLKSVLKSIRSYQ